MNGSVCFYSYNPFVPTLLSLDVVDVMDELTDVKSRYNEIGTQLRITADLDEIRTRSPNNTIAMTSVIKEWLKGNYNTEKSGPPTWRRLVEVVANPNGGNNNFLAQEIAKKTSRFAIHYS